MHLNPPPRRPTAAHRSTRVALFQVLEDRRLLSASVPTSEPFATLLPSASSATVSGLTPAEVRAAYGFTAPFDYGSVPADGSGQTIAIIDAYSDPTISADLTAFDAKFGLANPTLSIVNQTGGTTLPAANSGWATEVSLDVEWAHAIAPGAKILLVEATSSSDANLFAAVNYARDVTGVSVVSMSFGGSEFSGETSYDADFTTPAGHAGVTFLAAAGDDGTSGGPSYPAVSGRVIGVGGTSLTTTGSYAYSSESTWSDTGGGVSKYELEPSYQRDVQTTGYRTSPDVSYDGNPNTGFAVYDSDDADGWMVVGGTSAGTPQWAGLIAITDQGRAIYGGYGSLDGSTNTLPALYSTYGTSRYAATFHDVTTGSSGSIAAKTGYDEVTGLGTPYARGIGTLLVDTRLTTAYATSSSTEAVASKATARAAVVEAAAPTDTAAWAIPTAADDAAAAPAEVVLTVVPTAEVAALTANWPAPAGVSSVYGTLPVSTVGSASFEDADTAASTFTALSLAPVTAAVADPTLPAIGSPIGALAPTASTASDAVAASARPPRIAETAVAAGAVVALWVATASARERRRQAESAAVLGDRLIGVLAPRG
jgi:hypothetical protein